MARRRYWTGFTTGALVGAGAATGSLLFTNLWGRARSSRILRLEKSIQVGRPVQEVFDAWLELETLPAMSEHILDVQRKGNHSHWRVRVNGREMEWDSRIEQLVPNEAIAWKSTSGPKHTGRVTFAPLGKDTLLHVTMNYAPPIRLLRPFLAPMAGNMEGYIEAVLRDFKRALETRGAESGPRMMPSPTMSSQSRATGTFGETPAPQTSKRAHKSRPEVGGEISDTGETRH